MLLKGKMNVSQYGRDLASGRPKSSPPFDFQNEDDNDSPDEETDFEKGEKEHVQFQGGARK